MVFPAATLEEAKAFMDLTSTNNDVVIQMLLDAAIVAIGSFCNRDFVSSVRTEYRNGNGSTKIQLVGYPITQFHSVGIDNQILSPAEGSKPGYKFVPLGRNLYLQGQNFNFGERNVVLSYTAGYGDAAELAKWPQDLKLAVLTYVTTKYRERSRLGVSSKTLAGESISFTADSGRNGVPNAVASLLLNYVNVVPESGL